MGRKGRRIKKAAKRQHGFNEHHFLYPRTSWNYGFGLLLRYVFTARVPIGTHDYLHREILSVVPRPDEDLLEKAWYEYEAHKDEIDEYKMTRKMAWLYKAIPDPEFREAMQIQIDYFTEELGGSY